MNECLQEELCCTVRPQLFFADFATMLKLKGEKKK